MKKKIRAALLALMMVTAFSTQAFAYSYYFHFTQPYDESWTKTPSYYEGTSSPYVSPSTTSAETMYYLIPRDVADAGHVDPAASDYYITTRKGRHNFTYRSGYGGAGQNYYLAACPTDWDFYAYGIGGTWSP